MERLTEEVRSAYPDSNTRISHETVRHMPYLEAVLNESMRLRPIEPQGLSRIVPKEGLTLGGYFLPAGVSSRVTATLNNVSLIHLFVDMCFLVATDDATG